MYRIAHALEISFTKQAGTGSGKNGSWFHGKERVIAFLVTTAEVRVVPVIVVQERSLATNGARRVLGNTRRPWPVWRELMEAVTALILLETKIISAITIKVG